MMSALSRREFLKGCSAAIAGMSGARLSSALFGNPESEPSQPVLVSIFLRGGADVLNLIPPIGGVDRSHYEAARTEIRVPAAEALPLGNEPFGLHPAAERLHEIYAAGDLAIVQATGMHADTRSHFEAMSFMERGAPNNKQLGSGWIARHLASAPDLPTLTLMPALSMGSSSPQSFATYNDVIALDSSDGFSFSTGYSQWHNAQRQALRRMYGRGESGLHRAGLQALNASDLIELNTAGGYTPASGVEYRGESFGRHMRTIAQMVKLGLGLRAATVDLGGWDTHDDQGSGTGGYFANLVEILSDGLAAFYADLAGSRGGNYLDRVTVVVMSEFGRRLRENGDAGTDHGHGGAMLVIGGKINGGLYGAWPGLASEQLYDNADLAVTTDYRHILSEILVKQLGNPNLGRVFPDFADYSPLGLAMGDGGTINYDSEEPEGAEPPLERPTVDESGSEGGNLVRNAGIAVVGVGAAAAGLVALRGRGKTAK